MFFCVSFFVLFFLVFLCQGINRAKTKAIQSNTFIKGEKIEFFMRQDLRKIEPLSEYYIKTLSGCLR